MTEQTITAAAVITFCSALEDGSAELYETLSGCFPEHAAALSGYAADCRKAKLHVVRTYQETITDALEAGYAFDGLTLGDSMFGIAVTSEMSLAEALAQAIALESAAAAFYVDIADRSQGLLATIPGAFRRVARTRAQRQQRLAALVH